MTVTYYVMTNKRATYISVAISVGTVEVVEKDDLKRDDFTDDNRLSSFSLGRARDTAASHGLRLVTPRYVAVRRE